MRHLVRLRRRRVRGDDGFTLMEAVVGMTVMGIFMAMFTGSLVMMFHSSNRSQAVTQSSQQINNAFLWLDRHVRYASYVSEPGRAGSGQAGSGYDWYVEFHNADQDNVCYQVRIDGGQLQQRSWTGNGSPSAWTPLATGVTNGDAVAGPDTQPFYRLDAAGGGSEALKINIVTAQGSGDSGATSQTHVTLPALNTTAATPTSGECEGNRP